MTSNLPGKKLIDESAVKSHTQFVSGVYVG